jgi:hypothetical protein
MKRFEFHLRMSHQQYLDYYRGAIKHVVVQCHSGVKIQFPAALLTPFVSPSGVSGHFVLTCDENGKGSHIQRLTGNAV